MDPPAPNPLPLVGVRHRQVFMMMLGVVCSYLQKLSLAMALVAMSEPSEYYPAIKYTTWQKGILSSSYYYGFVVSSIPMSVISNRGGALKTSAFTTGFLGGFICILTPIAAVWLNFEAVCVLRFALGVIYGGLYPAFVEFYNNWVIPQEREQFAWAWIGPQIAGVIVNPLGGILAKSLGGWPSVLYCPGLLSIIWGLCSLRFLATTPGEHATISDQERKHVERQMISEPARKQTWTSVPWLSFITSGPVWITIIAIGASRWFDGVIHNFFPTFLHGVYGLAVETNGFLSVLPPVSQVTSTPIFAFLGGKLRNYLSMSARRKFWNSVCYIGMAVPLLILYLVEADSFGAIALFVIGQLFFGAICLGSPLNILDLAPNYCGILYGYTCTLTGVAAAFSTTVVGYIITDEHDLSQWQLLFLIGALVYFVSNAIFVIFATTETQPWNCPKEASGKKMATVNTKEI